MFDILSRRNKRYEKTNERNEIKKERLERKQGAEWNAYLSKTVGTIFT